MKVKEIKQEIERDNKEDIIEAVINTRNIDTERKKKPVEYKISKFKNNYKEIVNCQMDKYNDYYKYDIDRYIDFDGISKEDYSLYRSSLRSAWCKDII